MGIKISELDPTASPSRDASVLVAHDGQTLRYTVAQILGLLETGDLATLTEAARTFLAAGDQAAQRAAIDAAGADQVVPPGTVIWFAASTAPAGYLKANGALVSRTTYATLFAVVGTTFGTGDGSTTFALPDLRGEFIRGFDDGRGVDSGRVFGSAQAHAFASHTHTVVNNTAAVGGGGALVGGATHTNGNMETSATGGTETRPRNVALLACIKF